MSKKSLEEVAIKIDPVREKFYRSIKRVDAEGERRISGLESALNGEPVIKEGRSFAEFISKEVGNILQSSYVNIVLSGVPGTYIPDEGGLSKNQRESLMRLADESKEPHVVKYDGRTYFLSSFRVDDGNGGKNVGSMVAEIPMVRPEEEFSYLRQVGDIADDKGVVIREKQDGLNDKYKILMNKILKNEQGAREELTSMLDHYTGKKSLSVKDIENLSEKGRSFLYLLEGEERKKKDEENDIKVIKPEEFELVNPTKSEDSTPGVLDERVKLKLLPGDLKGLDETDRLVKQYIESVKKKNPKWKTANQGRYFASIAGIDFSLERDPFFERYKDNLNRVIEKRESLDFPKEILKNSYTSIADILKTDAYKERKSGHFPTVTDITNKTSTQMLKQLPTEEWLNTNERGKDGKLSEYELIQRIILDMNDTPGEGEMPEADRGGKYSTIRNAADLSEACILEAALYAKKKAKSNGMKILIGNPKVKSALEGYGSRIDKIFGEGHTKKLLEDYGFNK